MRWLTAGVVLAVLAFAPLLMALSGPVRSFSNPNVACGSNTIQDGGYNLADAAVQVDGGYEIDLISAESMASIKIVNPSAQPVYLGGATVQPGTHVLAICTDTATCDDDAISIDTQSGSLYCTAQASTTPRTLAGGY